MHPVARLARGSDGQLRCWWCGSDPLYVAYHDDEWGRPLVSDDRLFEKICLEGFQSGLSWLTILRKRDAFREVFAGFDIATVAAFGDGDIERALGEPRIVRHRGKIVSTINNARRAVELVDEFGSIGAFLERYRSRRAPGLDPHGELPSISTESVALSRDLKRRGWTFVGPTTMYAFLQSAGYVNDHLFGCHRLA